MFLDADLTISKDDILNLIKSKSEDAIVVEIYSWVKNYRCKQEKF